MFIGAVPAKLAQYIAKGIKDLGLPACIGCSGAFTVERALGALGVKAVSNDISLFSSAIAAAVLEPTADPMAAPFEDWLAPFCQNALDLAASVLVLSGNWDDRDLAMQWARREAVQSDFGDLHAKTKEKIAPTLATLRSTVEAYTCGDVEDHFERYADGGWVQYSFMPTYLGGYEELWATLEGLFKWDAPRVPPLDDDRKTRILQRMMETGHYVAIDDQEERCSELGMRLACIYDRPLKRAMYLYSDFLSAWMYTERPFEREQPVKFAESFDPKCQVQLTILDGYQARYVREMLTYGMIDFKAYGGMGGGIIDFGVLTSDGLVGAFGVRQDRTIGVGVRSVYMTYDVTLNGLHPRLSKLIPMLALSREALRAAAVRLKLGTIERVETTAFTKKAVSMKYRGVLKLESRSEGKLNYVGTPTGLSIRETMDQWRTRFQR